MALFPTHPQLPTLRQILAGVHLRLIVFAVALAGLTLISSGFLVIDSYAHANIRLVARTVSYSIEPAMVFGDGDAVKQTISMVVRTETATRIEVIDAKGRRVEDMTRASTAFQRFAETWAGPILRPASAVEPISHAGQPLGQVRVTASVVPILRYLIAGLVISLCCLGITILATRILAQTLQKNVIDPLEKVADVAHAVRAERDFNRRVPSSGIAEVDQFTSDFNSLLAELQGWQISNTLEREELERKANYDQLTGLGNRALFVQRIEDTIAGSVRGGQSFAVLYFDANEFKQLNDLFGHIAGDVMLVAIARMLSGSIRNSDDAFRLGGDEFAVILSPVTARAQIDAVIERIVAATGELVELPGGHKAKASLSVGVAVYPDDGVSPQDLIGAADAEMYENKIGRVGLQEG